MYPLCEEKTTHHPLNVRIGCVRDKPREDLCVPYDTTGTARPGEPVSETQVGKQFIPGDCPWFGKCEC